MERILKVQIVMFEGPEFNSTSPERRKDAFLYPAPVSLHSSGIWVRSSVFVGVTVVTNRQTDHAICVATGRIFTLCTAMRPKNYRERQNWRQFRGQHDDESMKYRQHVVKLY